MSRGEEISRQQLEELRTFEDSPAFSDLEKRVLRFATALTRTPSEVPQHLFDSLPSQEVRITAYNQSARQISIEGEANTAALVYQFAEKVKKQPDLQNFTFDMQSPRILPNDHAQFRLEGRPR